MIDKLISSDQRKVQDLQGGADGCGSSKKPDRVLNVGLIFLGICPGILVSGTERTLLTGASG